MSASSVASLYDDALEVSAIEFSILSADEIRRMSVDRNSIYGKDVADLYDNNEPKRGGLFDPHGGVIESYEICQECGETNIPCPGHFSHIELATPVFHIGFIRKIQNILACACIRCSTLLIPKNSRDELQKKNPKVRFTAIKELAKNMKYCPKCGNPVPKILIDSDKKLTAVIDLKKLGVDENIIKTVGGKTVLRNTLDPLTCLHVIEQMSREDKLLLGLNVNKSNYENMIIRVLPVPPVPVHPPARVDTVSSTPLPDYITRRLVDIIKTNQAIRKHKEQTAESVVEISDEKANLLQFYVSTMYDSGSMVTKEEQKGQAHRAIFDRWRGKPGRIRGNLMGKRVDFSARTVITGDPNINLDEVAIPISTAKILTYDEIVTSQNIEYLQGLVRNGRDKYPGANFVRPAQTGRDGRNYKIDLKYGKNITLHLGDVVERHLKDNDIVLLNRQPTLHKLSMMGHRVRVLPEHYFRQAHPTFSTFRINVSSCAPYNADYDGDEMNMHVAQSVQARTELANISDVRLNPKSPSTGLPIMGAVLDACIGARTLTHDDTVLDWKDASNIIMYARRGDNHEQKFPNKSKSQYTGREIFSYLLPMNINQNFKKGSEIIKIKNSQLTEGTLTSKLIGKDENFSLIGYIIDNFNSTESKDFIFNVQRIGIQWLLHRGFTIGLKDFVISEEIHARINTYIKSKKLELEHKITEMENNPDLLDAKLFEETLKAELNVMNAEIGEMILANESEQTSNRNLMNKAGLKADKLRSGQVSGCVGQINVEGERIKKRLNNRTLVHFVQNDDGADARGFLTNSYTSGLSPIEYFLASMGGREGMISTSIKTAEVGYIQRKFIKILEDLCIRYDGTVRNSNDNLVQLLYGDSNMATEKQFEQKINYFKMSDEEIRKNYGFDKKELKKELKTLDFSAKENEIFCNKIIFARNKLRKAVLKTTRNYFVLKDSFNCLVNFDWIINKCKSLEFQNSTKLTPQYVIKTIKKLLAAKSIRIVTMNPDEMKDKTSFKQQDERLAKFTLKALMYDYLNPKKCILEYNLTKEQFDQVLEEIKVRYRLGICNPGDSVGTLCAECMEPVMQSTLNTFHLSGVQKSSGVQGIPRIKELMSATQNPKTPRMIIYLEPEFSGSKSMANKIASHIRYTVLSEVSDEVKIYYDPNPFRTGGIMEQDTVENIYQSASASRRSCQTDISNLPWLLRIKLNRDKMYERDITLLDIKSKLCYHWAKRFSEIKNMKKTDKKILEKIEQCAVLSNFDNSREPVIHVRFDVTDYDYSVLMELKNIMLNKIKLKGIDGINSVDDIRELDVNVVDEKTHGMTVRKEFVIYTSGINMKEIRYLKGVDLKRTTCDNIWDIYGSFGVESTRHSLVKEFEEVTSSMNIGTQHIMLIADMMTSIGEIVSIDRHGVNKIGASVLQKASFEQTPEHFLNAAFFGERDNLQGVTGRIMLGQVIKAGTGICDVIFDHKLVESSEYIDMEDTNDRIRPSRELMINSSIDDIIKRKKKHRFVPEEENA